MDGSPGFSRELPVEPTRESELRTVDMSAAFLMALLQGDDEAGFRFDDELRAVRRVPELTISIDWTTLNADPTRTRQRMRWMKAIAEGGRDQQRVLTIRGTRADRAQAAAIEPNVLASGIRWESTDQTEAQA